MSRLNLNSAQSSHSFAPYTDTSVHEHNHRYTPHLHSNDCERYSSGFDKNRSSRYYFTKSVTPCRVYLSYNEKLLGSNDYVVDHKEKLSLVNQGLNGRKLSARTLKTQLKVSPQFIEDAKNFIFIKETMSLVPPITQTITFNPPLTYADMAVMPLHLPPINQNSIVPKTKHTIAPGHQVKQVKINLPKSNSPSSISWSSSDR